MYECLHILKTETKRQVSTFSACYLHFLRLLTNTYTPILCGCTYICLAYSVSGPHTMAQNKSRGFSNIRGCCVSITEYCTNTNTFEGVSKLTRLKYGLQYHLFRT